MGSIVRVGLIGFGYWGPNLARNLNSSLDTELVAICDASGGARAHAADHFPSVALVDDSTRLLTDPDVDALVLATPAATHAALALRALESGKHVLIEKPMALTVDECDRLIGEADRRGLTLMVGHTFRYHPAVRWLRDHLERGDFGRVLYMYGQRLNLGRVRTDVNVVWNLAPHDFSMAMYLLDAFPVSVRASGGRFLGQPHEDVAFVQLHFPDGTMAYFHLSWLDPQKTRSLTVVGSDRMVVFDDTELNAPITVFDSSVERTPHPGPGDGSMVHFHMHVRQGDRYEPRIPFREPLADECNEFADCIRTGRTPLTDGHEGRRVVAVLQAVDESIQRDGALVPVDDPEVGRPAPPTTPAGTSSIHDRD